ALEAVGLTLGGGAIAGVSFLELLSVSGAAAMLFLVLEGAFGLLAGGLATLLWLLALGPIFTSGNCPEELALAFQAAVVFFFWRAETGRGSPAANGLGVGMAAAACALLRPNLAVLGLVSGVLVLARAMANGGGE